MIENISKVLTDMYVNGNGLTLSMKNLEDIQKNLDILNFNITLYNDGILHTKHAMYGGVSIFKFKFSTLSELQDILQDADLKYKNARPYSSFSDSALHPTSYYDQLRNVVRELIEKDYPRRIQNESNNIVKSLYIMEQLMRNPINIPIQTIEANDVSYNFGMTYNVLMYVINQWSMSVRMVFENRTHIKTAETYKKIVLALLQISPIIDSIEKNIYSPEELFWTELETLKLHLILCDAYKKLVQMDMESKLFKDGDKNYSIQSIRKALECVTTIHNRCKKNCRKENNSIYDLVDYITHIDIPLFWKKTFKETLYHFDNILVNFK